MQRFILRTGAASLLALAISTLAADEDVLERFRWQNRVLLVFAGAPGDPELAQQQGLLDDTRPGLTERDLVVITALGNEIHVEGAARGDLSADHLRHAYDIPPEGFRVLLIGKDGGVKLREEHPVATDDLFALIDAMPMRRREMRERGSAP